MFFLHKVTAVRLGTAAGLAVTMLMSASAQRSIAAAAPAPSPARAQASHVSQVMPLATVATSRPNREVFGFATAGSLGDPTIGYPSWNFDLLSTVAFFSIAATYTGVLVANSNWSVWDSSTLAGLVSTAHAHGVKVVVTLTAEWHDTVDFCDTLYNGDTTAQQIVNQVVAKGIDGVNVDYEGQLAQCNPTNPGFVPQTDQALLTAFVKDLRGRLDAVKPGYYLSIDTYSGSAAGNDGFFNIGDLSQYVDSFFVMAYDMDYSNQNLGPLAGCKAFCMNPVSPQANYYWNDTTSMSQYVALVGAGKVILGQPYYGRVACVASLVAHATATSHLEAAAYTDAVAVPSSPDVKPGTFAAHRGDAFDPSGQDRWDTWYDNSLGCWREMYFDDVVELGTRYDLVNQDNLRGVGFWTLNYGAGSPELWSTIDTHFVSCMAASSTTSVASPQSMGTMVTFHASSINCGHPLYQFWVKAPGSGTWQIAQPYSSNTMFIWDTASHAPGTYQFAVWALESGSAGLGRSSYGVWDSLGASSFTVTAIPLDRCTSVPTSYAPPAPELAGTQVTLTASAATCSQPRYQFWLFNSAKRWQLVQAYSTNASFDWNTLGLPPGAYPISVWARDASSLGAAANALGSWDTYAALTISVYSRPCTGVSLTAVPASPQLAATAVTLTATAAAGCPTPEYQFWIRAPGSPSWKVIQPYSTMATLSWDAAAQPAGVYAIAVWVKDNSSLGTGSSSLGSWDAIAWLPYTLTSEPCSGLSTNSSPSGTAAVGTAVTIGAAATGCPSPDYEFWMLAPGSQTWQLVQGYSPAGSFSWPTTGEAPGAYQFSIWARDKSSVGTAGSTLGRWDEYATLTYTLT